MTTKIPVRSILTTYKVASTDAKSRLESFSDKMVGAIKAEIPSSKVLDFGVTDAADVGYMGWCHFLKGPLPQGVTVELKTTYDIQWIWRGGGGGLGCRVQQRLAPLLLQHHHGHESCGRDVRAQLQHGHRRPR